MKCTIINCDMCGCRIYKNGWFRIEEGAVTITAKTLEKIGGEVVGLGWKRRKYHICPQCVERVKGFCSGGGASDENT